VALDLLLGGVWFTWIELSLLIDRDARLGDGFGIGARRDSDKVDS